MRNVSFTMKFPSLLKQSLILHFTCLLFVASQPAVMAQDAERLVGKVYDANTGARVYTEEHSIIRSESQSQIQTRYIDIESNIIGERVVNFQNGLVVSYELEQPQLGIKERIERTAKGLIIEVVNEDDRRNKQVTYKNPESIVIDAGFDDFIVRKWDDLMAGKSLKFPFASTGQLDVVYLQLKRVDADSRVLSQAGKARFEMNVSNPFLRLLLDPVTIEYYVQSQVLASYRGISNIKNENEENYDVFIEFEHDRSNMQLASRGRQPLESKNSLPWT